jgi:adenylate kinase
MRIIITGTPGTGKTSISKELAKELDCKAVHVNELVKEEKLYLKVENGEYVADFKKLAKILGKELEQPEIIVESHLLCDLKLPADLVVVLRCEPHELENRLTKRNYVKIKLDDDVLSEVLDYCQIKAVFNYGEKKVMQIETTKEISAKTILEKIKLFEKTGKSEQVRWLNKMSEGELRRLSNNNY